MADISLIKQAYADVYQPQYDALAQATAAAKEKQQGLINDTPASFDQQRAGAALTFNQAKSAIPEAVLNSGQSYGPGQMSGLAYSTAQRIGSTYQKNMGTIGQAQNDRVKLLQQGLTDLNTDYTTKLAGLQSQEASGAQSAYEQALQQEEQRRQYEASLAEQQRQFNEQMAYNRQQASASAASAQQEAAAKAAADAADVSQTDFNNYLNGAKSQFVRGDAQNGYIGVFPVQGRANANALQSYFNTANYFNGLIQSGVSADVVNRLANQITSPVAGGMSFNQVTDYIMQNPQWAKNAAGSWGVNTFGLL